MKKILIPVFLLIGLSFGAFAQEKTSKELKGDKLVFNYDYAKAIEAYQKVTQLSTDGQRKLAESYLKTGKTKEAETTYLNLLNNSSEIQLEDYYSYAMILKSNGKYEESNVWMDKFASYKPTDLRAIDFLKNKSSLDNLLKNKGEYVVKSSGINSDDQDFGTCFYKGEIVFSSTRTNSKVFAKKYNLNGKPFLNLYLTKVVKDELQAPELFNKDFKHKMHDGPASFSKDGSIMAYTSNNVKDKSKDKIVELQLYFSTFADGKWGKEVPFVLNDKGYSVGHPSLSADGKSMYFVSDMPGGFGGSDIYFIQQDDKGVWGTAKNVGDQINTEGDELFPFFQAVNQMLYFASDGKFGLGGLDVLMSPYLNGEFKSAYNAGAPINGQYDDFAYLVNDTITGGYFSSNRTGGKGDDDIYSFKLQQQKQIQGITQDMNHNVLPYTLVTLLDSKKNVLDTMTTPINGAYSFMVADKSDFVLMGQKTNYKEGRKMANTFSDSLLVIAHLHLSPFAKNETPLEVGTDLADIVSFKQEKIYFDFDKSNIRKDASEELNKIVLILNQNPDLVVELNSHTDCRSTEEYNQKLSERRAQSSVEYIQARITNPSRISGKGYGETRLCNDCACEGDQVSPCSRADHQKNRRTEFIIVRK